VSRVLATLAAIAAVIAACTQASEARSNAPSGQASAELTVLAAASLTDAGAALEAAYEDANPGIDLTFSFDSSSALRGQVEAGAAADLFLSADAQNAQTLEDAGLTTGEQVPFASNLLAIVVPSDNPGGVETWQDLANPGLPIIAAGEDVPIQQYADEAVANLGAEADAPEGYADAVAANIVSREDNVRAVLARIELGEGDAAIVYVTDAASSDAVEAVEIPDPANVPATYVGVVLSETHAEGAAAAFLAWLTEVEAQGILADFGFAPAP
jgi:molybdate transport system substrate-binding protein